MVIGQTWLADAFVELADTTEDDFAVEDHLCTLTRRSVELVEADAAGVVIAERGDRLQLAAHTTDQARDLDLAELRSSQGPGLDCLGTGRQVANVDPDQASARWPVFSIALSASDFCSVHAVPLQRRGRVLGAMTLLCRDRTALSPDDLAVGQALADVAAIGLLQHQALRQREALAGQLQSALDSRVVIEQAKGVLAAHLDVDVETAFTAMRDYARRNRQKIHLVAAQVVDGTLPATAFDSRKPDTAPHVDPNCTPGAISGASETIG